MKISKLLLALLSTLLLVCSLFSLSALAIGEKDNIFSRWEALPDKDKDKILDLYSEKCEDELKLIDACVESGLISKEIGDKLKDRLTEMREEGVSNRRLPPIFFPSLYQKNRPTAAEELS